MNTGILLIHLLIYIVIINVQMLFIRIVSVVQLTLGHERSEHREHLFLGRNMSAIFCCDRYNMNIL